MKCPSCGGELRFANGLWACDSCTNKIENDYGMADTEVYISVVDYDENGRRIKDSIIADEIYHNLEQRGVKVFLKRNSLANGVGDEAQGATFQAIFNAKIVLLVGCNMDNFMKQLGFTNSFFPGKKIIPVYSTMRAYDLPEEISKFQALNFDSIGSSKDLYNRILDLLGKKEALEKLDSSKRNVNKQTGTILGVMIICAIIIASVLIICLMFDKENTQEIVSQNTSEIVDQSVLEETMETSPIISDQDVYEEAGKMFENGKLTEAIEKYKEIPEYKDTSDIIKRIYDMYDGYYQIDDSTLYINIIDGTSAEVIFDTISDNRKYGFNEQYTLDGFKISGVFTDYLEKNGSVQINLNSDSISFISNVSEEGSKVGNLEFEFKLENRMDRPMEKGVTEAILKSWLDEGITLEDIKTIGYSLLPTGELFYAGGGMFNELVTYNIDNTDVKLIFAMYDLVKVKSYNDIDSNITEYHLVGIMCPAEIIAADKIGEPYIPFIENGYLFVPNVHRLEMRGYNGDMECIPCFTYEVTWEAGQEVVSDSAYSDISENTMIGVLSEKQCGMDVINKNIFELDKTIK